MKSSSKHEFNLSLLKWAMTCIQVIVFVILYLYWDAILTYGMDKFQELTPNVSSTLEIILALYIFFISLYIVLLPLFLAAHIESLQKDGKVLFLKLPKLSKKNTLNGVLKVLFIIVSPIVICLGFIAWIYITIAAEYLMIIPSILMLLFVIVILIYLLFLLVKVIFKAILGKH
jgi:hypothetical protein